MQLVWILLCLAFFQVSAHASEGRILHAFPNGARIAVDASGISFEFPQALPSDRVNFGSTDLAATQLTPRLGEALGANYFAFTIHNSEAAAQRARAKGYSYRSPSEAISVHIVRQDGLSVILLLTDKTFKCDEVSLTILRDTNKREYLVVQAQSKSDPSQRRAFLLDTDLKFNGSDAWLPGSYRISQGYFHLTWQDRFGLLHRSELPLSSSLADQGNANAYVHSKPHPDLTAGPATFRSTSFAAAVAAEKSAADRAAMAPTVQRLKAAQSIGSYLRLYDEALHGPQAHLISPILNATLDHFFALGPTVSDIKYLELSTSKLADTRRILAYGVRRSTNPGEYIALLKNSRKNASPQYISMLSSLLLSTLDSKFFAMNPTEAEAQQLAANASWPSVARLILYKFQKASELEPGELEPQLSWLNHRACEIAVLKLLNRMP